MRKRLAVFAGLLSCVAIVSLGSVTMCAGNTGNESTLQSIREKKEQIEKAEKEKKNLKSGLNNVENIKKQLEEKKSDLSAYIVELDTQLAVVQEHIYELNEQISAKEQVIQETEVQLVDARKREDNQQVGMVIRAQQMYEKKTEYILNLLVRASGLGDLLNRAEYMEKLVTYDKEQWNELQNTRKYVELCEEQLKIEKEILEQTRENVELEQNTIELFIEQKEKDIIEYQTDIANQEKAIEEYKAMIQQQDEEIKALELAIEEEKKKLSKKIIYDGGTFKFPLASYTKVSCDFGNRIHPILKVPEFHNGIDFAAARGTAIYAAYDGVVVAAAYSPTMGNYVMIDHGDNLYTIYMHASTLKVSKDQVVTRGDTIALVGSTGRSTGNHLHFSVRRNGAYESPWNYITP